MIRIVGGSSEIALLVNICMAVSGIGPAPLPSIRSIVLCADDQNHSGKIMGNGYFWRMMTAFSRVSRICGPNFAHY